MDPVVIEIPPSLPEISSYEDLGSHSESVQVLARKIVEIPPGSSVEVYQEFLRGAGIVEVPYPHFKDYEYYWSIHSPDEDPRKYVLAGTFLLDSLAYSTINVIEETGGKWRTIWSVQHDPESIIDVRLWGLIEE